MSKFEAVPYIDIFEDEKKSRAEQCQWLVMPRDQDGYFGTASTAVARFMGPEAEGYARFHAEHLNAVGAMPIGKPETEPEREVCVHCFQTTPEHVPTCPAKSGVIECRRCNLRYLGNRIEPCARCGKTDRLVAYHDEPGKIRSGDQIMTIDPGNEIRKPETGKNPFGLGCPDCGAAEGDIHQPGCEAVAERQMAELDKIVKARKPAYEGRSFLRGPASSSSTEEPSEAELEAEAEDQPDNGD